MEYTLPCPCGSTLSVPASSAGIQVVCERCDGRVDVPSLSRLREMSNWGAYDSSGLDALRRMNDGGLLPAGKTCMISGLPTGDCLDVEVSWEAFYGMSFGKKYLLIAWSALTFSNLVIGLFLWRHLRRGVLHEDETSIVIPLRIDRSHHRALRRRWSRGRVISLLRQIPAAARFLDEYPMAKIVDCRDRPSDSLPKPPIDQDF